jgi:hypothetical protein
MNVFMAQLLLGCDVSLAAVALTNAFGARFGGSRLRGDNNARYSGEGQHGSED